MPALSGATKYKPRVQGIKGPRIQVKSLEVKATRFRKGNLFYSSINRLPRGSLFGSSGERLGAGRASEPYFRTKPSCPAGGKRKKRQKHFLARVRRAGHAE